MNLQLVRDIGSQNNGLAIVSVARPDGSIHSSLVNAGVLDHPATGEPVVGFVVAGGARKLELIRSTGRATLAFQKGWQWASVEGETEIDAQPELLRAVFRAAGGTHDDWDEYDRVMAAEGRTAVLVTPHRILTNAL